jgi:hypothetical protein
MGHQDSYILLHVCVINSNADSNANASLINQPYPEHLELSGYQPDRSERLFYELCVCICNSIHSYSSMSCHTGS